jgi:hypothetical protein
MPGPPRPTHDAPIRDHEWAGLCNKHALTRALFHTRDVA